jgi:outer membrane protein TolC
MIHMRTWCKIAFILLLFQEQGYTAPITLTLAKAIERALENNASMKSQRMSFKQAEMSYLDAWNAMFVPSVSLSLSTSSTYTVGDLEKNEELKSRKLHGFPSPRASLVIGSYTIFNFWKDWNNYENARLSWVRTQEQFQERLRSFRFSVSNSYFRSKIVQDNLEYSKRFIRSQSRFTH